MAEFTDTIDRFVSSVPKLADQVMRKIVFDVGTSLVIKSPVGNPLLWENPKSAPKGYVGGRFRGNWQLGINNPGRETFNTVDETGQASLNRIQNKLDEVQFTGSYYITNHLAYSIPLENGHSKQAPNGMVHLVRLEFEPVCRDAARALRQAHE